PKASGITSLKALAGQTICVESGTTTELNLADRMREIEAPSTPLRFQTRDQTYAAYLQGRCVAVTSDRSQLAGKRTRLPSRNATPTRTARATAPCTIQGIQRRSRHQGVTTGVVPAAAINGRAANRSGRPGSTGG
ncbi:MAG: hypothetical protein ACKOGI_06045, partial [Vulcanococcus sp.]